MTGTTKDITNEQLLDGLTGQLAVIADNMATRKDLKVVAGELDELRVELRNELKNELNKQAVLIESLDHDFKAVAELISDNLKVAGRVNNHGERLDSLEADTKLIKSTVTLHSRQLKKI